MFSSYKYEFLTKAYYNLTSLLLSNLFLSTLSSLYVLATVASVSHLCLFLSYLNALAASFMPKNDFTLAVPRAGAAAQPLGDSWATSYAATW